MAKIIVVLYDDPVDGYPKTYARDAIPGIKSYPGGQTAPTPQAIDFKPGELLGSVSGALGLKKWAADNGHKLVVTSDKEGANSTLDRELPDAEVVISQPFWPAYMTAGRFAASACLSAAGNADACSTLMPSAPMSSAKRAKLTLLKVHNSRAFGVCCPP